MINRSSTIPLYHQIKQDLLDQIQSGHFSIETPMPSEKQLEKQYGVSSITIRRALGDLETAGYITRQPGRGTYVLPARVRQRSGKIGGFPTDLAEQGFKVKIDVIDYFFAEPSAEIAQKLGIPTENIILHTRQVILANDEPVAMGYVYHNYLEHISFTREEISTDSVVTMLEQRSDIVPSHAERSTQLTKVSAEEGAALDIEPNEAVIEVYLTVYDQHENCLVYSRSLYRGDRYVYHESISI